MSAINANADSTVVVCKCGGAIMVALTSSLGPKDHREIGAMVADGCTVRHATVAEIRAGIEWCKCSMIDLLSDLPPTQEAQGSE